MSRLAFTVAKSRVSKEVGRVSRTCLMHSVGNAVAVTVGQAIGGTVFNPVDFLQGDSRRDTVRNAALLSGPSGPNGAVIEQLLSRCEGLGWTFTQPLGLESVDILLDLPRTTALDKHGCAVQGLVGQNAGRHGRNVTDAVSRQTGIFPLLLDILNGFGLGHPRADGIDAQGVLIGRGDVVAQGTHEANHAMLRGLVDKQRRALLESSQAREEENGTVGAGTAVMTQIDGGDARNVHGAKQIDIQHLVGGFLHEVTFIDL